MSRLVVVGLILVFSALQMPGEQEQAPVKELVQYVRDAQKAGLKDAQIQQNAVKAGWPALDVGNALEFVRTGSAKPAGGEASAEKSAPKEPQAAAAPPTVTAAPAQTTTAPPANPQTPPTPPGSTPTEAPADAGSAVVSRGVPDDYRIGEGDVVQVSVWGEPAASVGSVVVRPDGRITMPLIKDIPVSGLTPAEAEKTITDLLSKQIRAANVTVIVNQINSKKVFFVGGGVKKEGPLAYTYRMTIMQAISEAGGLTDYAKRKKIYVLRNENGRQYKLSFDYDAVLRGEHMELNIQLLPGDTIVVPNH
ncbi:MAG: polysaccharide export protein [Candidatus Solibacter sp.]|nr:polysaccharide export protein [Candidatus Solibacter sp.]